jgi:hypothetical protein
MFGIGIGARPYKLGVNYTPLAIDYFARVADNGDFSLTAPQKAAINTKILALVAIGATPTNVDRLFADKYCYTAIQALTPWIWNGVGTGLATAVGSPDFTAGIGWTHNGSSYINTKFNPFADGVRWQLDNAGFYFGGILDYTLMGGRMIAGSNLTSNYLELGYFSGGDLMTIFNSGVTENTVETGIVSNILSWQLKRTSSTVIKSKLNGGTENTISQNSSSVVDNVISVSGQYRGSVTLYLLPNTSVVHFTCFGNSTLDIDLIETALAS